MQVGNTGSRHGYHDVVYVDRHDSTSRRDALIEGVKHALMTVERENFAVDTSSGKVSLLEAAQRSEYCSDIMCTTHSLGEELPDVMHTGRGVELRNI